MRAFVRGGIRSVLFLFVLLSGYMVFVGIIRQSSDLFIPTTSYSVKNDGNTGTPSFSALVGLDRYFNIDNSNTFDHEITQSSPPNVSNEERQILFVHVGKAGGETIKEAFEYCCSIRQKKRRRQTCYDNLPNSTLSNIVVGYAHGMGPPTPLGILQNITSLLIVIRHPVDRILSWYGFVNPHYCNGTMASFASTNCKMKRYILKHPGDTYLMKQFFIDCFPTVEDFAIGTNAKSLHTTEECKIIAKIVTEGGVDTSGKLSFPFYAHARANYKYYYTKYIEPYSNEKEIFVIRTKHMWDDMLSLERQVGGSSTFDTLLGTQYSHGSETYKNAMIQSNSSTTTGSNKTGVIPLPDPALKSLCCAMIQEFILYKSILYKASNLNAEQKHITFQEDLQRCNYNDLDTMLIDCAAERRFTDAIKIIAKPIPATMEPTPIDALATTTTVPPTTTTTTDPTES